MPLQIPIFILLFPGLGLIRVFYVAIHIFLLKSVWMNLKILLLVLNRTLLNSATYVTMQRVLKNSHWVIGPTSIIKGINSQYIVRRVTIIERGLFFIRLSFCAVFFLNDIPDCFKFALILKCSVWNWRLTKLPLCFRSYLLCRTKFSTLMSAMGGFSRWAFSPLRNQILGFMAVQ